MTTDRSGIWRVACLVLAMSSGLIAATEPKPVESPEPDASPVPAGDPAADVDPASSPEAASPRQIGIEVAPTRVGPGMTPGGTVVLPDVRPPAGELLPEGALLLRRRGWMRPVAGGAFLYIFDRDADGNAEPPMLLQPSQRLTEMVRIVQARPETVTFSVTGQVYVYQGRNYILPTTFATVTQDQDDQRREAASAAAAPEIERLFGRSALDEDPAVQDLVERVERASSTGAGADRARPEVSRVEQSQLRREGTMLVSQRGRLSRGSEGWSFTIDNDADTAPEAGASPDRVGVLPCQNLEVMERLIDRHGERLTFTISGPVFVFRDRNYVMPTMYLVDVDREGNLTSAQ